MDDLKPLIQSIEKDVRARFDGESTGHDWHHIDRVRKNALFIAHREGANPTVVELAALLHDIDDHKFNGGDWEAGANTARQILNDAGCPQSVTDKVCHIISKVSFKGAGVDTSIDSMEGKCVQDADRLDAIGALGIARCFAYGGKVEQSIYDPALDIVMHETQEHYAQQRTSSINHFYEKLLLLKDRMQTNTGRMLANERHAFMEDFLERFYSEWNGAMTETTSES